MSKTPEEKKQFKKGLEKFINQFQPKVMNPPGPDEEMVVAVTRVSTFDLESNDLWSSESAKSYPREGIYCYQCTEPVVVSNGMWREYMARENKSLTKFICEVCFLEELKNMSDEELIT